MSTPMMPSSQTPKPVSEYNFPNPTRLPELTPGRSFFRQFIKLLCRVLVFCFTRMSVSGLEHFPPQGPGLVVINHLGDPDIILVWAALPGFPETLGKIELREIPALRVVTNMLGVIWVRRGQPDRHAISIALEAFRQGRFMVIAPEGRESVSGALEEGTEGAAFLALRSNVPIIPVTITGTEFRQLENNLGKLRRTRVKIMVGTPFHLSKNTRHRESLRDGTRTIMETLARQLPPEYRGVYSYVDGK